MTRPTPTPSPRRPRKYSGKGKKPRRPTPRSPVYIMAGQPGPSRAQVLSPRTYFTTFRGTKPGVTAHRRCNRYARGADRISRAELDAAARQLPGYRRGMKYDELCKFLGVYTPRGSPKQKSPKQKSPKRKSPNQKSPRRASGWKCGSRARGPNRYSRAEIDAFAQTQGIKNYRKYKMDDLCQILGLSARSQSHAPSPPSSPRARRRSPTPPPAPPRVPRTTYQSLVPIELLEEIGLPPGYTGLEQTTVQYPARRRK